MVPQNEKKKRLDEYPNKISKKTGNSKNTKPENTVH